MPIITQPNGLIQYLHEERNIAEQSRKKWEPELKLWQRLAEVYDRLTTITKVSERQYRVPAELFLVVQRSLHGSVSLILRRRIVDADNLTRSAIEATASAYRLWKHPELLDVYMTAYPTELRTGDSRDWQPSQTYKKEFNTNKLFSEPAEAWKTLRTAYAMFSVMAAHAGAGALSDVATEGNRRSLTFFEGDDQNIERTFYSLMAYYLDMFRFFFNILRNATDNLKSDLVAKDFIAFREEASAIMNKRAPWIAENVKSVFASGGPSSP